MKRTSLAALLLSVAFAALTAQSALAVTPACTSISNTATVTYKVGSDDQTPVDGTVDEPFIVGNKINFTVVSNDDPEVSVTQAELGAVLSFTVTNTGNANQTFLMSWSDGTTNPHAGPDDNIDMLTPGVDTLSTASIVTGILAPGETQDVTIVADTPATPSNNDVAVYVMTGTAYKVNGTTVEAENSSSITSSAGTCTGDVVFNDSDTDVESGSDRNGKDSAVGAFIVTADQDILTVAKASAVYSDPINGVTGQKMIPGSVVTYTITLTNTSLTTAASTVSIADTLDGNLAFGNNDTDATYGSSNGAFRDAVNDCTGDGAAFGVVIDGVCTDSSAMWADPTLTISSLSVPKNDSVVIKFQANIK